MTNWSRKASCTFLKQEKGSVFILSIWAVVFLSIFALYVGYTARMKIRFIKKIEDRDKLRLIAESGICYTADQISDNLAALEQHFNVSLSSGYADCILSDEESKININTADLFLIERLLGRINGIKKDELRDLACAIEDWRDEDNERRDLEVVNNEDWDYKLSGFPYTPKNSNYNLVEELLLVKGMKAGVYQAIKPYITVYGSGKININTCTSEVMEILGIDDNLIRKILLFRKGENSKNKTVRVFKKIASLVEELNMFIPLTETEKKTLNDLIAKDRIGTDSKAFNIVSVGKLVNSDERMSVRCVVDENGQALYWKEDYLCQN